MMLALIVASDRVIVSPIPEQVAVRYCIHPGSRLPFSEGFVACWEGYSPTDWKWSIAVTRGFDGRMRRELEGVMLSDLPAVREWALVIHKKATPSGTYCPGFKRVVQCEPIERPIPEIFEFKPVEFDVFPEIDVVALQDAIVRELQIPAEMLFGKASSVGVTEGIEAPTKKRGRPRKVAILIAEEGSNLNTGKRPEIIDVVCPGCDGKGGVTYSFSEGKQYPVVCPRCEGSGKVKCKVVDDGCCKRYIELS
jgi:hypothetical protein